MIYNRFWYLFNSIGIFFHIRRYSILSISIYIQLHALLIHAVSPTSFIHFCTFYPIYLAVWHAGQGMSSSIHLHIYTKTIHGPWCPNFFSDFTILLFPFNYFIQGNNCHSMGVFVYASFGKKITFFIKRNQFSAFSIIYKI